jgi:hypothetical protein
MRKKWSLKCIDVAALSYLHASINLIRRGTTPVESVIGVTLACAMMACLVYTLLPEARAYVGLQPIGRRKLKSAGLDPQRRTKDGMVRVETPISVKV